tara:strand:+ start:82735 stop:83850 length:1116 start_codon:yes stop_codon:yes gene_type:complete
MTVQFLLPKWFDLHVHLRQGSNMVHYVQAQIEMACAGVLAMPNTLPPTAKILQQDDLPYWSLEEYRQMLLDAGADAFEQLIVPLYLTKDTTPNMIEQGAQSGLLQACKYYPPHGTTNSDHGRPLANFMENGVFQAMEEYGIVLCIHGEKHGLKGPDYFDSEINAERSFYEEDMVKLAVRFPKLKIVAEHMTTKEAVAFVKKGGNNIAGSITPQHLLYTVGNLVQGLRYHLYCLPLVKFNADLEALRQAVTDPKNTKFFAGTDSAPHTKKATECGCAAGCFTGGVAPQLYAEAFEEDGCDLGAPENQEIFKRFLCTNGPNFYGFKPSEKTFMLSKTPDVAKPLKMDNGETVTPLPVGLERPELAWSITDIQS